MFLRVSKTFLFFLRVYVKTRFLTISAGSQLRVVDARNSRKNLPNGRQNKWLGVVCISRLRACTRNGQFLEPKARNFGPPPLTFNEAVIDRRTFRSRRWHYPHSDGFATKPISPAKGRQLIWAPPCSVCRTIIIRNQIRFTFFAR